MKKANYKFSKDAFIQNYMESLQNANRKMIDIQILSTLSKKARSLINDESYEHVINSNPLSSKDATFGNPSIFNELLQ